MVDRAIRGIACRLHRRLETSVEPRASIRAATMKGVRAHGFLVGPSRAGDEMAGHAQIRSHRGRDPIADDPFSS